MIDYIIEYTLTLIVEEKENKPKPLVFKKKVKKSKKNYVDVLVCKPIEYNWLLIEL